MKIGVFGSALGEHSKEELKKAFLLGKEIGNSGHTLVTGATFGLPNSAVKGVQSVGGQAIGISPALSKKDHVENWKLPVDDDIIIYTGFGYDGRNLINIRSSDIALFIKGSIGTLNEFTIAVKEEKVIGILENVEGVSNKIREIVDSIKLNFSPTIIYSDDPVELVKKTIEAYEKNGN